MSLESETIFVDESGDAGLSPKSIEKGRYFVIGFTYCSSPSVMRKKLRRLLKDLHQRDKYPLKLMELKFYLPKTDLLDWGYSKKQVAEYDKFQPQNRNKIIKVLTDNCSGVYTAICNKTQAKDSWTGDRLGNYMFAQTLIVNVLPNIKSRNIPIVIYDKGRLSGAKSSEFKIYLVNKDRYFDALGIRGYPTGLGPPVDISSTTEPGLWASDIVAGAFRHAYMTGETYYKDALKSICIKNGYSLFWREE